MSSPRSAAEIPWICVPRHHPSDLIRGSYHESFPAVTERDFGNKSLIAQQHAIADPPKALGPFTLTAVYDAKAGQNAFAYDGTTVPPIMRVSPGGVIRIHYVNNLPVKPNEQCATGPCMNMTNLHFHGLHVSPNSPQDDVLTMMAMPGESLDYKVKIRLVPITFGH